VAHEQDFVTHLERDVSTSGGWRSGPSSSAGWLERVVDERVELLLESEVPVRAVASAFRKMCSLMTE
jgi:hypothetical protein